LTIAISEDARNERAWTNGRHGWLFRRRPGGLCPRPRRRLQDVTGSGPRAGVTVAWSGRHVHPKTMPKNKRFDRYSPHRHGTAGPGHQSRQDAGTGGPDKPRNDSRERHRLKRLFLRVAKGPPCIAGTVPKPPTGRRLHPTIEPNPDQRHILRVRVVLTDP
jgi:hypothetical protein